MNKAPHFFYAVGVVALLALAIWAAWYRIPRSWTASGVTATKKQAATIIQDLDRAFVLTGEYPASLSQEYTSPIIGLRQWKYSVSEDRSVYQLVVVGSPSGYPSISYSSANKTWSIDE